MGKQSSIPEVLDGSVTSATDQCGIDLSRREGYERALGCVWIPMADILGVRNRKHEAGEPKRGVLSRVSMIFNPLGIVAPFTLRGKLLVQRLWSLKYRWNDQLRGKELLNFRLWLAELTSLENVFIPRCHKTGLLRKPKEYELHTFATHQKHHSELWPTYECQPSLKKEKNNNVTCSFIMAKTLLAPLKQLRIVRLELQAAVLACRPAKTIKMSMSYRFCRFLLDR